jgi:hypothetical protein
MLGRMNLSTRIFRAKAAKFAKEKIHLRRLRHLRATFFEKLTDAGGLPMIGA